MFPKPHSSFLSAGLMTAVACAGLAFAGNARAAILGVNFVQDSSANQSLQTVTGTAGVLPQANWNNVIGTNPAGSGSYPTQVTDASGLMLADGSAATGTTLSFSAPGTGFSYAQSNTGTQNEMLQYAFLDSGYTGSFTDPNTGATVNIGPDATISVDNLPSSIAGSGSTPYEVILYVGGQQPGRGGDYTVNGVSQNNIIDGPVSDSFTEATSTTPGNYIIFNGVTGTNLSISEEATLAASGSPGVLRASISAFQVVSVVPEPATLGLMATGTIGLLLIGRRRKTA